ncbi:hypothetical protein BH10ACI1_BH10ACI1_05430 [soil metagenome]
MEHDKIEKRRDDRRISTQRDESSVGGTAWKIVGGTLFALAVAAVIVSLPDIKRYIKISTM